MNPNVKDDIVYGAVLGGSVLFVACLVLALTAAAIELGVFSTPAKAAVEHTTINRADHLDSGDSELPLVRFANLIDECLNDLPVPQQIILVKGSGMFFEFIGKGIQPAPICGGFWQSTFRQVGVQLQVAAMERNQEISTNPVMAGFQGFLVGL
jgi:hypothetical protein